MVTREDWEAGAPVAITSADVPRIVAAYEQAARCAELVWWVFAEVGLPRRTRRVAVARPEADRVSAWHGRAPRTGGRGRTWSHRYRADLPGSSAEPAAATVPTARRHPRRLHDRGRLS